MQGEREAVHTQEGERESKREGEGECAGAHLASGGRRGSTAEGEGAVWPRPVREKVVASAGETKFLVQQLQDENSERAGGKWNALDQEPSAVSLQD